MKQLPLVIIVVAGIALVMSIPLKILAPMAVIGFIAYLIYDRGRNQRNRKVLQAFNLAAERADSPEAGTRLQQMLELRKSDRFPEMVVVHDRGETLLLDDLKACDSAYNPEVLADYIRNNQDRIAFGVTYDELEAAIREIRANLGLNSGE